MGFLSNVSMTDISSVDVLNLPTRPEIISYVPLDWRETNVGSSEFSFFFSSMGASTRPAEREPWLEAWNR